MPGEAARAFKRVKRDPGAAPWKSGRRRSRRRYRPVDSLAVANVRGPGRLQMSYAKGPFPPVLLTKMTYAATLPFDMTTGYYIHTFRANSLYDPDYTGAGGQPRFYDTLLGANNSTAPYRKYCVYYARFKVTYYQYGVDAFAVQGVASITQRIPGASAPSTIAEVMMRDDTVYKPAGINNNAGIMQIEKDVNIGKILGVREVLDNTTSWGAFNAGPTDEVYVDIGLWSGSSYTAGTYRALVEVTFWAQLSDKNDVADS